MLLLFPDDKPQRQTKHIFRLLTKSDLTKDVLDTELFILWPDNAQWYAAEIIKVRPDPLSSPGLSPAMCRPNLLGPYIVFSVHTDT